MHTGIFCPWKYLSMVKITNSLYQAEWRSLFAVSEGRNYIIIKWSLMGSRRVESECFNLFKNKF